MDFQSFLHEIKLKRVVFNCRYRDPYADGRQRVRFVQAVIGETSGFVDLVVTKDVVSMEAHIDRNGSFQKTGRKIKVRSMTVQELAEEQNIPKSFGILSIDAEGVGDKVKAVEK